MDMDMDMARWQPQRQRYRDLAMTQRTALVGNLQAFKSDQRLFCLDLRQVFVAAGAPRGLAQHDVSRRRICSLQEDILLTHYTA